MRTMWKRYIAMLILGALILTGGVVYAEENTETVIVAQVDTGSQEKPQAAQETPQAAQETSPEAKPEPEPKAETPAPAETKEEPAPDKSAEPGQPKAEPQRSVRVKCDMKKVLADGDKFTLKATLVGFANDDQVSVQWQYYDADKSNWVDAPGKSNRLTYKVTAGKKTMNRKWRIVVRVQ